MPVGWAAAAAAVGGIAGAALQGDAARDAARTQAGAAGRASDVQLSMFNTVNRQQQPFIQAGYGANAELMRLLGIAPQTASGNAPGIPDPNERWNADNGELRGNQYLPPGTTLVSTDNGRGQYYDVQLNGQTIGSLSPGGPSGRFTPADNVAIPTPRELALASAGSTPGTPAATPGVLPTSGGTGLPTGYLSQTFGPDQFRAGMDPGYQWRLQQGAQGVMNTAAVGGSSLSGPAIKALLEYNQGAASQEYGAAFDRFQTQQGNIFQRLSSLAQTGQSAAAGVGQQGVATAGNVGANIIGAGNAAAAGQIGAANAYSGALSDLGSVAAWYGMNRQGG